MISRIYMMKRRPGVGLDDKYVFRDSDGTYFEAGPDRTDIGSWFDKFAGKDFGRKLEFLSGIGIKFMADVIWKNDDRFRWRILKNRTISAGDPPFSSLEEAQLKSAVLGWPEPKPIYD